MPTIGDELLTMIDRRRSEKLRSNSNLDNCETLQQSRFLSSVRYGNSCSGLARKYTMMRMSRKFEINGIYPRPDRTSVKLAPRNIQHANEHVKYIYECQRQQTFHTCAQGMSRKPTSRARRDFAIAINALPDSANTR